MWVNKYLLKDDIIIKDAELRGLAGISIPDNGIDNPFESSDVVSSLDLRKAVFRHMGFTGIRKKIFGDPEEPFHVMIYGGHGARRAWINSRAVPTNLIHQYPPNQQTSQLIR